MQPVQKLTLGRSRGRARGRVQLSEVQEHLSGLRIDSTSQTSLVTPTIGRGRSIQVKQQQTETPTTSSKTQETVSYEKRTAGGEPVTFPSSIKDKKGSMGTPVKLITNYVRLYSKENWSIYQYRVDFSPIVESSKIRRELLSDHNSTIGTCYLFDGMSDMKTIKPLEKKLITVRSQRRTDGETIDITIKFVSELALNYPEVLHFYNTQMRRNLQHLQFALMGRYYFDKHDVTKIPQHNIEVWKGVLTAIREFESGLMMVVNTVHKVLHLDTVLDQMKSIKEKSGRSKNYIDACIKELIGNIVMTRYNNKTYRIDDIDWCKSPVNSFETAEGEITYKKYYQKQYNIDISDDEQPLLICLKKQSSNRSKDENRPVYLIPELCYMTGLTEEMRTDNNIMKDLANYTRISPDRRVENLLSILSRINCNPDVHRDMTGWGLKLGEELVTIRARVMPSEKIIQDQQTIMYSSVTADFSREVCRNRMHSSVALKFWIVITAQKHKEKTEDFISNLKVVCNQMGMTLDNPNIVYIPDERIGTYLEAMKYHFNPRIQIMMFIVPNKTKDRYDAIKKLTCIEMGIPSQVVVVNTLNRKSVLRSVATKIGIQINCKLGGEAWVLKIPFKINIMVIGYDSYKDSSQKNQTIGAFVASLNKNLSKWYSQVRFHYTNRDGEMRGMFTEQFTNALKKYHEYNKQLPELIFFYRDGVSDGQIQNVLDNEVSSVRKVLDNMSSELSIRLAFIVVNKRISARFFIDRNNQITNPPPGTVVDTDVTQASRYDFYLVSQHVSQGTVSPTLYNVLEDTTGLKPDHIQIFTYKLTHLYYNWPGTIRVPAPCQYAHKLAFLTNQSLHKNASEQIADTLFYL